MEWEGRSSDHLSINLSIDDTVDEVLKKRHLGAEELQFAIYYAEKENDKLYDAENENHCLIKCAVGEGLYHVEYNINDQNGEKIYNIATAYACTTMIK